MKHLLLLCVLPATVLAREPEPAKTDWFVASKYGVFVHYLTGLCSDYLWDRLRHRVRGLGHHGRGKVAETGFAE